MTTNRIIIGDDSELPDALDVSELIPVPPQTSGAAVDSRMRNRRIGVRRAAGHKRLILVGVILGVLLLAVAALAVLASPLFAIVMRSCKAPDMIWRVVWLMASIRCMTLRLISTPPAAPSPTVSSSAQASEIRTRS